MEIASAPLYLGPLALQFWSRRPEETRNLLLWAATRIPGDKYEGCDGEIHTVQSIVRVYARVEEETDEENPSEKYLVRGKSLSPSEITSTTNWCLFEVDLLGTDGSVHGTLGQCASPLKNKTTTKGKSVNLL